MENILFILIAYLIGSFPSAVWFGNLFHDTDIREYGSGNSGATNTFRILGLKAGISVLLMDILKGCIAVNLVYLISDYQLFSSYRLYELKLVLGISAVFGHLFPIYTGFRGGKGIATLLGLMLGVYWQAAVLSVLVFIITFLISKYVSLSSIVSTIFFPVIVMLLPYQDIIEFQNINNSLIIFSVFVPIITLITHQKNIERLIRREENKAKFDKN